MRVALPPPPPAPPPAVIAEQLRAQIEGRTVLVGEGQFSPHLGRPRVGVLRLDGDGAPALIWDGFPEEADVAAIRAALSASATVWPGALDTMYATPWTLAWTLPPAAIRAYDPEGPALAIEGSTITLFTAGRPRRRADVAAVTAVRGWAGDDRVRRGVDLVLRGGEAVTVAEREDPAAAVDPTYDHLDLSLDAAWIPAFGRALAAAIGAPYEASEHALR